MMSSYTSAAVIQVLLIGVLVTFLLLGAFLVLNLGLMSKRDEDRVGGRTPSDVGFLKNTNWPQEKEERRRLPADDEETAA
jgi:hypothetical protein